MKNFKLDPAVKATWCEALRSGKYKQGREYLGRNGRYCCLGVAREIKLPNAKKVRHKEILDEKFLNRESQQTVAEMNDGANKRTRKSFPQIADWIEENL